jgi:hypothetical protein
MINTVYLLRTDLDNTIAVLKNNLTIANESLATLNGKLKVEKERDESKRRFEELATTVNAIGSNVLLLKRAVSNISILLVALLPTQLMQHHCYCRTRHP